MKVYSLMFPNDAAFASTEPLLSGSAVTVALSVLISQQGKQIDSSVVDF